jgi:hypothetical protein
MTSTAEATMGRVYSVAEAAERLELSVDSVYKYCQQGRLGVKHDGRYVITRGDIRDFAAIPRIPGWPRGKSRKS